VPLPAVSAGAGDEVADDGAVEDPAGAGAAEDPELAAGAVVGAAAWVLVAARPDELDEPPQPASNPTAATAMVTLTTEASRPGINPCRRPRSLFPDSRLMDKRD
jgi:hypothetical protein